MNCRPLDLAVVIHDQCVTHPLTWHDVTVVKAGTIVKVVRLVDEMTWELEEPIRFEIDMFFLVAKFTCWAIDDSQLRPLRDPGADAVDEMVAKRGPAPMTLTEVREVQHG